MPGSPFTSACRQSWPFFSAGRTPVQGLAFCGGRQRRSPTGCSAKGMPLKATTPSPAAPWSWPLSTLTVAGAGAAEAPAANRMAEIAMESGSKRLNIEAPRRPRLSDGRVSMSMRGRRRGRQGLIAVDGSAPGRDPGGEVGVVGHAVGPVEGVDEEVLHLVAVEGPRTQAAEDGDLVAGLVDRAVAVEALRKRERGRSGPGPGDQLGLGRGREAVEVGLARRAGQLDHLQA